MKEGAWGHCNEASVGKRTWRGKGSKGRLLVQGGKHVALRCLRQVAWGDREKERGSKDITVNHGKQFL